MVDASMDEIHTSIRCLREMVDVESKSEKAFQRFYYEALCAGACPRCGGDLDRCHEGCTAVRDAAEVSNAKCLITMAKQNFEKASERVRLLWCEIDGWKFDVVRYMLRNGASLEEIKTYCETET